jgi:hypothetical protein
VPVQLEMEDTDLTGSSSVVDFPQRRKTRI